MKKKAILLANIGTPDSPKSKDVRKYLSEFLNDKRVITLPFVLRKLLVNGIIVPFRTKKSSQLYEKLWTEKGSPLLYYSNELLQKVQRKLENNYKAYFGMRYGNPSLKSALENIKNDNPDEIIILPLFPQYASSTTESVFDFVKSQMKKWKNKPEINFIPQFYNNPDFIKSFSQQILKYDLSKYDHIIFSYHGLPLSHINKIHPEVDSEECSCIHEMPDYGNHCYKATCYHTTRLLVNELGIKSQDYSVSFQSRLTKNWLSPFTDQIILDLAKKGVKKILVIAPSFVTDCLETIVEIEDEYRELFLKNNGEKLTLVESLNSSDNWAETIVKIIK